MPKANDYFNEEEFWCKCGCGFNTVNQELLECLTDVRQHFNSPLLITSGNRCTKHNKTVDGEENSKHTLGIAADFKVKAVDPLRVQTYLEEKYPDSHGIGRYPNRTHVDVRPEKARWTRNV